MYQQQELLMMAKMSIANLVRLGRGVRVRETSRLPRIFNPSWSSTAA
jgi:hypothetical protein